ncbi:hypothetical protein Tco_1301686 [Tanacetum coccineum]
MKYPNAKSSKDVPEFNTFFELSILDDQIQGHRNTIQQLDHFKAENEKVKQHYQEIYNSINVTRVKTIERTTSLQTEIENLKTQLKGKMPCVTNNVVTPKVSAIAKYAIEVEPIPPSQRNNRNVQQGYLNRLKDTLDTLREIVEEAISKRTSNNSLEYARHPEVKKSNVPISPSTEVNSDTKANRSKPRRNIKNDRTSTTKSVIKKKVEDHIRNTKSDLHKQNHVDSSISLKRTVINSISDSRCKTCTKCIISSNHDKCVEKFVKSSNKPPVKKVWRVKQVKQTWKATGKLFANVGYQWKPIGRKFTLGEQCPLTRITKPKVVPVRQWKPTGRIIPLGEQCRVTRSIASTSAPIVVETQAPMVPIVPDNACTNQLEPNINWGSGTPNSPFLSVFKCRSYRSSCNLWTQAVHNI